MLWPSTAAIVDTMISGSVVATLMIVAPMMNLGIRVTSATHTAPSTNQSPPLTISTTPTMNSRYIKTVSICSSFCPPGHKKSMGAQPIPKKRLHAR